MTSKLAKKYDHLTYSQVVARFIRINALMDRGDITKLCGLKALHKLAYVNRIKTHYVEGNWWPNGKI